ncbi:MAG: SIMPL domain-containing protein [Chitinophagaceae bacterium]
MKKYGIACLFTLFAFCIKANAQTVVNQYPKTINVSGSAEMEIVPDEIYVQVDLKEYKKKGEKVELEKIKSDFLASCKTVGIADSVISIASYEGAKLNSWYWRKAKKDPDLYASISYQIKFQDSKKMDQLVDVLDEEGTSNFTIVKVSHSRIIEFRKQLKIQAIKAAKEKGIYLAESINEKVGEAVTITEPQEEASDMQSNGYYRNQLSNLGFSNNVSQKAVVFDMAPGVNFKKIKLRYEVNVVFALK